MRGPIPRLSDYVVDTRIFTIKCPCGKIDIHNNTNSRTEAAREFKLKGWRLSKYSVTCPDCMERKP